MTSEEERGKGEEKERGIRNQAAIVRRYNEHEGEAEFVHALPDDDDVFA